MFWKETSKIKDEEATWQRLRKGTLKRETEGMILDAQNQALRTNLVRHHIDKERDIASTCRICGQEGATIAHVVAQCTPLTQNEKKESQIGQDLRHDPQRP